MMMMKVEDAGTACDHIAHLMYYHFLRSNVDLMGLCYPLALDLTTCACMRCILALFLGIKIWYIREC